jgi:hypothetical protein
MDIKKFSGLCAENIIVVSILKSSIFSCWPFKYSHVVDAALYLKTVLDFLYKHNFFLLSFFLITKLTNHYQGMKVGVKHFTFKVHIFESVCRIYNKSLTDFK